jgi:GNAT superfamily N-acetyltransferase
VFASERLNQSHQFTAMPRGTPGIDRRAVTYVWHRGDGIVVAHYTLSPHRLHSDQREVPAVLLTQLALDQPLQRQALAGRLLADALGRVLQATRTVEAAYVVAEAEDERTAAVYQHHGFIPIPGTRRLIQRTFDIKAAIG